MIRRVPASAPFPYPTLFRSVEQAAASIARGVAADGAVGQRHGAALIVQAAAAAGGDSPGGRDAQHRQGTGLDSNHMAISYAVFSLGEDSQRRRAAVIVQAAA